ncbi:MAG: DUF2513 domain-containing protein [Leptolyngbya sp.]|nr:DUF2513 domain-containing protein [Leptolyngbya sp.]
MKRDLELLKKILMKVEELPVGRCLSPPLGIEDYDEEIVFEHVRLLQEANFIEAIVVLNPRTYEVSRLLNDGHDFVANAKNPAIWKKTIDFLSKKGGDVSLALVKGLLVKIASNHLGL